jgi:hypothetical protein
MKVRRLAPWLLLLAVSCGSAEPEPAPATIVPTAIPSPTPVPAASDLHLTSADILLYPDPELYAGDLVGFDVIPRNVGDIDLHALVVRVYHQTTESPHTVAEGTADFLTFDGVPRARMVWTWDTTGLVGEQQLSVWLDPDDVILEGDEDPNNNVVSLQVHLRPASDRPAVEENAAWKIVDAGCCIIHYLAGTAAERDLAIILDLADRGVSAAADELGLDPIPSLDIYLIDRVIGHGGYARGAVTLSYLDRGYAGYDLETVISHEATHLLDATMMGETQAPALLREGLAVWTAGGHLGPEPIPERAAVLPRANLYVPLDRLADDFYRQQHEAGYLEGGALVTFLVERYGWEGFLEFYASFDSENGSPSAMLDAALVESFGVGLADTEVDFLRWLDRQVRSSDQAQSLQMTINLFDTIRLYQQVYEPSALFSSAWFIDSVEAERRGIVADLMRHSSAPENVALEAMLISAQDELAAGNFEQATLILNAVNLVLERGSLDDPMVQDYMAIVEVAAAAGYEIQSIDLEERMAAVYAAEDQPVLLMLELEQAPGGWQIVDVADGP